MSGTQRTLERLLTTQGLLSKMTDTMPSLATRDEILRNHHHPPSDFMFKGHKFSGGAFQCTSKNEDLGGVYVWGCEAFSIYFTLVEAKPTRSFYCLK